MLDVDVPLISDWNGALAKRFGAARVWRWMEDVPRTERFPRRRGRYGARIVALRGLGRARLRRATRGRAGVVGLAVVLYLGAGLLATSPAVFQTDHFLGYGSPARGTGHAGRPPADGLRPLAARAPARAGSGAVARSVQLPAGGRASGELRRLAVRGRLRAAAGALRDGGGLERLRAPDVRRRRRARRALAARARPRARPGARRRACVRAGAVPRRAVDRSPARADLDAAPARALRRRAPEDVARGRRARLDPALRPGPPRPRRDPVRARVRASRGDGPGSVRSQSERRSPPASSSGR